MNFPSFVLPYHGSPWRWKTFVAVLTQTIPAAGAVRGSTEEAGAGDAGGGALVRGETFAGAGAGAAVPAGARRASPAPAVTIGEIFSIVFGETPARDRSATDA
jgi:hypothetical protein